MYALFLDDIRDPLPMMGNVEIARSSKEAIEIVSRLGCPSAMYLDHDLGGDDTSMRFLHKLQEMFPNDPPKFMVHSMNPVGRDNIVGFMLSWIKSVSENIMKDNFPAAGPAKNTCME